MSEQKDKSILVAMSGGVDSSLALYLLRKQGYRVAGATMKLWDYDEVGGAPIQEGSCCDISRMHDARAVCESLGVPHYVLDFTEEFKKTVIENFVSEYSAGRTPNPCIVCNTMIKWERFLKRAEEIGCGAVATGHYAKIGCDAETGRYWLRRGTDETRDQSYALWGLKQESLARTCLPLGDLTKKQTRQMAAEAGLKTADIPESREICFIPDDDYERFLREWSVDDIPGGDIVNRSGEAVGRHKGIPFYTVGQRRGLGIAHSRPLYVIEIDPKKNRLVVGEKEEVFKRELTASRVNWVSVASRQKPFKALVQIRYQHRAQEAEIIPVSDDRLRVVFELPQPAITPGQSAVIYDDDLLLAGGIID